jgi:hypothetical protein
VALEDAIDFCNAEISKRRDLMKEVTLRAPDFSSGTVDWEAIVREETMRARLRLWVFSAEEEVVRGRLREFGVESEAILVAGFAAAGFIATDARSGGVLGVVIL